MIISKTPYRVSFAGGLSDLPTFYKRDTGNVVSTTIDKYVYIAVKRNFEEKFRVMYKTTEEADSRDDIKHPIVQACLNYLNIKTPLEITSIADVPSGTGLGSSSAFTVGLLNALFAFKGVRVTKETLARIACEIEIEILGEPIGVQDQYAAAYGGFNFMTFTRDEIVLEPMTIDQTTIEALEECFLLFNTGLTRRASDILTGQKKAMDDIRPIVCRIRDIAIEMRNAIYINDIPTFGHLTGIEWQYKKQTSELVTNDVVDKYYSLAADEGALGVKLCGAGAGGFLLVFALPKYKANIRRAFADLHELPFKFEEKGSEVIKI